MDRQKDIDSPRTVQIPPDARQDIVGQFHDRTDKNINKHFKLIFDSLRAVQFIAIHHFNN